MDKFIWNLGLQLYVYTDRQTDRVVGTNTYSQRQIGQEKEKEKQRDRQRQRQRDRDR